MRKRAMAAIALGGLLAIGWWAWPKLLHTAAQAILDSRVIRTGNMAPDFTLLNAQGTRIHLSDYRGQIVLLNFWATWCVPCKAEIPWFIDFQEQRRTHGFTVLGVSMDEDGWKVVTPYMAEQKMNYPVVLGDEKVNQLYGGIVSLPTSLLIDRKGRIVQVHNGLISKTEWLREIDALGGT